jgi:AAA domain
LCRAVFRGKSTARAIEEDSDILPNSKTPTQRNGHLEPESAIDFGWLTSCELDDVPDAEYLIDGMLVARQPGIIAGAKKTLKTSTLVDLAISLATGTRFLGLFPVVRAVRVGIMSGESGEATIKEIARRVCKAKGCVLRDILGSTLQWSFRLPQISRPPDIEAIRRDIDNFKLDVLMIDPIYLSLNIGEQASNLFAVGEKLATISALANQTGCTPLLAHHNTKASAREFNPPELDDIAWSGFSEWARQWLLLGRRESFDPESAGEHKLWLSAGGSAGHYGRWAVDIIEGRRSDPDGRRWDVQVVVASKAVRAAAEEKKYRRENAKQKEEHVANEKNRQKLLNALNSRPNGETKSELRDLAGLNNRAFAPALEWFIQAKTIEECDVQKSRRSYPGYRLTRTKSDSLRRSDKV